MTKTTTVYTCDICKREFEEKNLHMNVVMPFLTYCNWTDGMWEAGHVEFEKTDICEDCLIKSTNLVCDFQGKNKEFREEQK